MDITLLNDKLHKISVIDVFDSAIWTDRYFEHGDFEIYTPAENSMISLLTQDRYLVMEQSDHVMIIETINLKTDVDDGNKFVVKGRSLESILDRRIVWSQTLISGSLQNAIKKLLDQNAISPSDPDRKIKNLEFQASTDVAVTSLSVDAQIYGDTLYNVISSLCESAGVGFKITLSEAGKFVFTLYAGTDRSYSQITNPFITFSHKLANLTDTDYFHSKVPYKTVTLVAGEGEGTARLTTQVASPLGAGTDLQRREKFTDASDLSKTVEGGTLSNEAYLTYLAQRGLVSLSESLPQTAFDGKIDVLDTNYVYGEDYFLGDIVQIENEYGLTGRTRVEEIIFSQDPTGLNVYPLFNIIE